MTHRVPARRPALWSPRFRRAAAGAVRWSAGRPVAGRDHHPWLSSGRPIDLSRPRRSARRPDRAVRTIKGAPPPGRGTASRSSAPRPAGTRRPGRARSRLSEAWLRCRPGRDVEHGRRLIGHEQLRVVDKCSGNRDLSPLAAGQLPGRHASRPLRGVRWWRAPVTSSSPGTRAPQRTGTSGCSLGALVELDQVTLHAASSVEQLVCRAAYPPRGARARSRTPSNRRSPTAPLTCNRPAIPARWKSLSAIDPWDV